MVAAAAGAAGSHMHSACTRLQSILSIALCRLIQGGQPV
eukprot:CAMPEP_0179359600 /NCGR_PEP_ID=MMETSP0797-20121207/79530_1 /TAXON_ID=47934 /ORGANISM="Dinophysis acuminata, Strain DAEP01" /LENGTH=38 /DNA_ID= /DNA_START= /DNA_END= /DNA_ORIENTATION=